MRYGFDFLIIFRLSERTYSLWGYLVRSTDEYLNPLYDHTLDSSYNVLKPDLRSQMMKFWTAMYNRFDNGIHNRESVIERISMAVDHIDSLEDHRNLLIKVMLYTELIGTVAL